LMTEGLTHGDRRGGEDYGTEQENRVVTEERKGMTTEGEGAGVAEEEGAWGQSRHHDLGSLG
jgi:hypothetical protein